MASKGGERLRRGGVDPGLNGQGLGQGHPLLLAARHLVGKLVRLSTRPTSLEDFQGPLPRRAGATLRMRNPKATLSRADMLGKRL